MGSIGTVDSDDVMNLRQVDAKDVVTLCKGILDKIGLSPSVEMCGQVAFLISASYSALSKY
jgi:hypothetical protein